MEKKQAVLNRFIIYILLISVAAVYLSCKNKDTASLKLVVPVLKDQALRLEEQRVSGVKLIDTLKLNNKGTLNCKLYPIDGTFYNLRMPGGKDIFLIASPGDNIKIESNTNPTGFGYEITGSPESILLNQLYDSLFSTRNFLTPLIERYHRENDPVAKQQIYTSYIETINSYRKYSLQLILENLTSLASLAALYQEVSPGEYVFGKARDMQYFKLVSDSLTKYYPKQRHVLALKRNFDAMYNNYQLTKLLESVDNVTEELPNLELPDLNGNPISLLDTKERFILLNFWESASGQYQSDFPTLLSHYNRYHAKGFSIYNVYLGKSTDTWKKIINYEEIGVLKNVADTAFPFSVARALYNIQSIPANYLIDNKENTILAKDISPQQLGLLLKQILP